MEEVVFEPQTQLRVRQLTLHRTKIKLKIS